MIDTGTKGCHVKIFNYIQENGWDIKDIATVILSHSHPDHIGSAAEIKKLTGCRILAHTGEQNWIEDITAQVNERPVPGFYELVDTSVKIDAFLNHGDKLQADTDITMEIIYSPGHSKGSLNILFSEANILFTADSIPVRNDIPNYDNFRDLLHSLRAIQACQNLSMLLTSWTPPLATHEEMQNFLQEAENYIKLLDETVKNYYVKDESAPLTFCKQTITALGLPEFFVMPIVDRAFRSHLQ